MSKSDLFFVSAAAKFREKKKSRIRRECKPIKSNDDFFVEAVNKFRNTDY